MKTRAKSQADLPSIVPMNEETRAMLAYAESAGGRAKIDKARQEIRDGKGMVITPAYSADLNRRISARVAKRRPHKE
jgi:hypothetical protein